MKRILLLAMLVVLGVTNANAQTKKAKKSKKAVAAKVEAQNYHKLMVLVWFSKMKLLITELFLTMLMVKNLFLTNNGNKPLIIETYSRFMWLYCTN